MFCNTNQKLWRKIKHIHIVNRNCSKYEQIWNTNHRGLDLAQSRRTDLRPKSLVSPVIFELDQGSCNIQIWSKSVVTFKSDRLIKIRHYTGVQRVLWDMIPVICRSSGLINHNIRSGQCHQVPGWRNLAAFRGAQSQICKINSVKYAIYTM